MAVCGQRVKSKTITIEFSASEDVFLKKRRNIKGIKVNTEEDNYCSNIYPACSCCYGRTFVRFVMHFHNFHGILFMESCRGFCDVVVYSVALFLSWYKCKM